MATPGGRPHRQAARSVSSVSSTAPPASVATLSMSAGAAGALTGVAWHLCGGSAGLGVTAVAAAAAATGLSVGGCLPCAGRRRSFGTGSAGARTAAPDADTAAEHKAILNLSKPNSSVLVTGATGFLGVKLVAALLDEGHSVTALVRNRAAAAAKLGLGARPPDIVRLVDSFNDIDASTAHFDVVYNLAGEPLGSSRWTPTRIDSFFDSRVRLTERLVALLGALPDAARPSVLVSASAIGYYGVAMPSADVHESSSPAETTSVSHRLCAEWEAAAAAAEPLGIRVVTPRIGVVLGSDGGALAQMLPPFKLGLGGPMGSGEQAMPWIHVKDMLRVFGRAAADSSLSGPVNAVAPERATNMDVTQALGAVLRRPAFIPVPAFALRLLMGSQLADELLLHGQHIVPRALQENGFDFSFPTLEGALRDIVEEA